MAAKEPLTILGDMGELANKREVPKSGFLRVSVRSMKSARKENGEVCYGLERETKVHWMWVEVDESGVEVNSTSALKNPLPL